MKRAVLFMGVMWTLAGCHEMAPRGDASHDALAEADGKSLEHAIVLTGNNESVNIQAEYVWLRKHEPESKLTQQSLLNHGRRFYDQMDIVRPDGSTQSYFFDITSGFGKY